MATAKLPKLSVVLPKKLLTAARSSVRPSEQAEKGSELRNTQNYQLMNQSARQYRSAANITDLIRHLARAEGPFGTAVHNMVEVSASTHTVMAYDTVTHQFSPEGTQLASSILASMDTLYDYTEGYAQKKSIKSLQKMMLREAVLTGGVAVELVLSKEKFPSHLQLVGAETLQWISDGKGGAYPAQKVAGEDDLVELNIPTFWVDYVQADPQMVFPRSMLESAIKLLIYFEEFMEDIRRVVKQSGHNRITLTIDAEKVKKSAPREVQNDPVKLADYFEKVRKAVQVQMEEISPEQAMIMFDSVGAEVLETGMGTKLDYTPLLNVIVGQYATAMKTPPSVLGLRLESGSQALGNVETLIFLKSVAALHTPAETVMSRALTLAARLYGTDVYVRYKFDPVDLRPETELQAFKTMEQTRLLEQLSLGFLTDDEAAAHLRTGPRAPSAPPLSGTMFMSKGAAQSAEPGEEPQDTNNQSNKPSKGDTPMGRTLQPPKKIPREAGNKSK